MRIIPILLALGLAAGSAVAPAATAPVDDGSVSIAAAPAFSGALRSGQPLLVSGTITNNAGQEMDAGTATILVGTSQLPNAAALSNWLNSDDSTGSVPSAEVGSFAVGELAAGQVRSFSVTVPASSILLPSTESGVFPLTVRLASGSVQIDVARSSIVWNAEGGGQNLNLTVVAPLDVAPSGSGLLTSEQLGALTATGGVLDTQLTNAQIYGLALGVNPMILASIRLLGSSAPPSALDWLNRLETYRSGMFVLAYADADLALQRQAGLAEPLAPISFPIDESLFPDSPGDVPTPSASPTPAASASLPTPESLVKLDGAIDGLAWASGLGLAEEDLEFISAGGYTRTLTTSSDIAGAIGASPNVTVGDHQLTIADSAISELLSAAATAPTDADWALAMASLSSFLTIAAQAHPGGTVVATLARGGAATGPAIDRTLTALGSIGWIQSATLSAALSLPATPARLAEHDAASDRADTVKTLLESEADTARFATVVNDPTLVTGPQRLSLLALLSASWLADPVGWAGATAQFLSVNSTVRASVHLPESSQVNFPLDKGNLPIAVRNELPFPVTVYVTVRPERPLLEVLDDHVELTIEANSQARGSVPVQSIANGEVRTVVTLTSAAGVSISAPTVVVLNVQAGWETAATVVLAIIVVLLFGAGVWRTILRRRKARALRNQNAESTP